MTSIVAALILATTPGALSLELTTPQHDVLIGEPIKLTVRWTARTATRVALIDDRQNLEYLEVVVRRKSGNLVGLYYEYGIGGLITLPGRPFELASGQSTVTNVYLVHGGYGVRQEHRPSFVFSSRGQYFLSIRYREGATMLAHSNDIPFDVREPDDKDREVFTALSRTPWLLRNVYKEADPLIERYPDSPYLRYARVARMERWQTALGNQQDPQTGKPLGPMSGQERTRWMADQVGALAAHLLADGDWGAFEEERIWWAALYKSGAGDRAMASQLWSEIKDRFPGSKAAHQLEDEPSAR